MQVLNSKEKILAFLAGCTLAIASTTMLFSLTDDPRRGFDFHYADIMIPVLFYSAFMFKKLERPQLWVVGLGLLLISSTIWSEDWKLTAYSSIKFTGILLTFSCIRSTLKAHPTQTLLPLGLAIIPSVLVAGINHTIIQNLHAAWGLHGNPNMAGGTATVFLIAALGMQPQLLRLFLILSPAALLMLTGARGAILGVTTLLVYVAVPTKREILLLGVPVIIGVLFILISRGINPTGRFDLWLTTSNIILDHPWLGTGFDTKTQYEATNAHNIFLMFPAQLGIPLGAVIVGGIMLVLLRSKNLVLASILIMGVFYHHWITVAQGQYLFAAALTGGLYATYRKERNPNYEQQRTSNPSIQEDTRSPALSREQQSSEV